MRIAATGYGRRVALDLAPADLDAVRAVLPWWWHDDLGAAAPEAVFVVPPGADARDVVAALELDVAEHAVGRVFVHAGVVAQGERALLLPGASFAGKSTLTAALLDAGLTYLSDEYAVLDAAGRVHPYPRPLTLRTPTGRTRRDVAAAAGPLQVAAVAVLSHATDASWSVRSLPPGDAVLAVLADTVCARTRPIDALQAVAALVEGAIVVAGHRGEADEAVGPLRRLLAG